MAGFGKTERTVRSGCPLVAAILLVGNCQHPCSTIMMTPQPEACGTANCRLLLLQDYLLKQPDRLTAEGVVSSDQHERLVSHDMSRQ